MALRLYDHNQKAYDAAVTMLEKEGKAAIIHPTGSGKSFIAFKLAEEHPSARIFWLSPSRYIFRQQCENRRKAAPDSTINNIEFMTYARLMVNQDRVSQIQADYIILDEFHRCGAVEWSKGVNALLASHGEAKVLGLSATKLRYLDEQRDMAEELFEGKIASEMTLGEAIARNILTAPRYVISIYRYEEEWRKYQARVLAMKRPRQREAAERQLAKLRRALEQAEGIERVFQKYLRPEGKYIVFCSGVAHLEEMQSHAEEWFAPVGAYRFYTVCSKKSESEEQFRAFKKDEEKGLKLLFCIDMLNEGIHLEDVDGVILMRPTVSPVVYKQQIGRALTAGRRNAKTGEAPLILDIVNNFENLHSIHSLEAEFEEALRGGAGIEGLPEMAGEGKNCFQIIDETHDAWKLFCELQEKLDVGWEDYYSEAEAYYREMGHLEIPVSFVSPSGLPVGSWLQTQRRIYMGKIPGSLDAERIERLNRLGIRWESYSDQQWERYYAQAARYYARTGNLDVKVSYVTEDGFRLGIWLNNVRQYRLNGSRILSGRRQEQLEQIGMIWDKFTYKWERGYEAAQKYFEQNGNLEVPTHFVTEDGLRLGNWIAAQRQNRRGGNRGALPLSREQIERLDRIGMNWGGPHAERWERSYEAAAAYFAREGNLDVPYDYVTDEGIGLGRWVYRQRILLGRKKSGEPETGERQERYKRLSAIGMVWENDAWLEKWELARAYYEEHGNLDLPQSYVTKEGVWLGKWVYLQKERYRRERGEQAAWRRQGVGDLEGKQKRGKEAGLTKEQIRALESIGMDWLTPGERAWENAFLLAQAFYEEKGNLEVEKGYRTEDGFRLDLWLGRQRKSRRDGKGKVLSQERVERLEGIGMRW